MANWDSLFHGIVIPVSMLDLRQWQQPYFNDDVIFLYGDNILLWYVKKHAKSTVPLLWASHS